MSENRPPTPPSLPPTSLSAPEPPRAPWYRVTGTWWRYARWIIPTWLTIVLGLTAGATLYVVTHAPLFASREGVTQQSPDTKALGWPLVLTKRVNVLLMGIDVSLNNKRQILPFARTDTLILVSFDPERNQINALSIPRDTRAQIPGKGETKINAAYAYGGPKLTIATVRNFLGVPIDYYVKLGPESFARIIDALGGIEIDVEKDMKYRDWWGGLDINLKKGRQVLDGQRAADYIRFRADPTADIGRVARQQKMLKALFQKVKSPATLVHAPQLLRAAAMNTQTNLSMGEVIMLGMFGVRLKSGDIHTATLPGSALGADWLADRAKMQPLIAEMFYGVDQATLASTGIEVINGSGVPGLARKTAQRLQQLGFNIVRIDSVTTISETTTIIDRSGRPHVARLLAEVLGHSRIRRVPGSGADITVVLARDQASRAVSTVMTARR